MYKIVKQKLTICVLAGVSHRENARTSVAKFTVANMGLEDGER
jgi:hypothetical protein